MPDLWQSLTKTALRIVHERKPRPTAEDIDEVTDDVLRAHMDTFPGFANIERLKNFMNDILRTCAATEVTTR